MKLNTSVVDFQANDKEGNILHWTAEPWRPADEGDFQDDVTYARIRDSYGEVVFEIELSKLADLHDALFIADEAEREAKKLEIKK
jgi:hypothetical protein